MQDLAKQKRLHLLIKKMTKTERLAQSLCLPVGDFITPTKIKTNAAAHMRDQEAALIAAREALDSWQRQYRMSTEYFDMASCSAALAQINKLLTGE